MFSIKVSNLAGVDLTGIMAAQHTQISSHFAPIWGTYADIDAAHPTGILVPLSIEKKSDVPGALAYHDVDLHGRPYIRAFTDDTASAGVSLSSVLSHEILEVLGDAFITSLALQYGGGINGLGRIVDAELCDPVEADVYRIGNVEMSNFVTPWWFTATPPNTRVKYDYLGRLSAPFTLTSGGYYGYQDITPTGLTPYQQNLGHLARPWSGPHTGYGK